MVCHRHSANHSKCGKNSKNHGTSRMVPCKLSSNEHGAMVKNAADKANNYGTIKSTKIPHNSKLENVPSVSYFRTLGRPSRSTDDARIKDAGNMVKKYNTNKSTKKVYHSELEKVPSVICSGNHDTSRVVECELTRSNRNVMVKNADMVKTFSIKKSTKNTSNKLERVKSDVNCSRTHCVLSGMVHLSVGNVCAVVPRLNISDHGNNFHMNIIENLSSGTVGESLLRQCVSPVVYMQPHGIKFSESSPATIYLSVDGKSDNLICLCSDTEVGEAFDWRPMDDGDYESCDGYMKIRATHFSFYTTIVNKGYPEVSKMIYADEGGTLEIPHIPGLEVTFPASAVHYDIEATMKVMFADEPYDVDHNDPGSFALASPVVKLGPTGHHFNYKSKEKVTVRLPLPDAQEILENYNRPYLTFWESTTAEGQPLEWKLFKTSPEYEIEIDENGVYSVVFPVTHFTFYKTLWSVYDSALYGVRKIGASLFYPNFEFCVVFQAFMSKSENDDTFGLCVVCYRMGNDMESVGNYPVFVGSSSPRMITCSKLQIRVASNLFGPNTNVGEELLQQQEFFAGRQFDKQFACKYTMPNNVPVSGTIGKIYIEQVMDDGSVKLLFDFLVNKPRPGQEMLQSPSNSNQCQAAGGGNESWEEDLSNELATLLNIKKDCDLEDDVWEEIARNLGYTQLEIDIKFKGEEKPLKTLLEDYKKRGGKYNEFSSAMYKIKRKGNVDEFEERIRQELPDELDLRDESVAASKNGSLSPSRSSSTSGIVLPQMPTNSRKRRHSMERNREPVPPAKLIEVAQEKTVQEKWKNLGRALGLDDNQLSEIERNYETDGIQEKAYQMLLAWRERYPEQGSEELIKALGKWHLNGVARLLYCS